LSSAEISIIEAIKLAQSIVRRTDAQPLPLSNEQTFIIARALLHEVHRHESHGPHRVEIPDHLSYLNHIPALFAGDALLVTEADISYNGSWQARGGVGAFMMLARKWDRFEPRVKSHHYDVFEAIRGDKRREGVIDDIRDLRRYLGLVEAYAVDVNLVTLQSLSKESIRDEDAST
jgi:hypothetical protein